MLTYCVNCRKNTKNLDSKIFKTKNNTLFMQSLETEEPGKEVERNGF